MVFIVILDVTAQIDRQPNQSTNNTSQSPKVHLKYSVEGVNGIPKGKKVFFTHDTPHLLKCLRTMLLNRDIFIPDEVH